jgi:MFS family permease
MTLRNKKITIGILLILQFMASVTMSMVFSLAPSITSYFSIPSSNATFLNLGFVAAGLLSPIFGYLADKRGTKAILITGAFIFVLGHLLAAFSTTVIMYFSARFLVGLGYSAILGLIVSYLSKFLDHKHMGHTSAFLKLAFALGVFISPILASSIVEATSFKSLYLGLTFISLGLFLALFMIPHVSSSHQDHLTLNDIKILLKDKTVRKFLGVTLSTGLPGVIFFNFLSVFLSENGYTQLQISSIYSMIGLGSISSAFVIFFLNKRFGMTKLFQGGLYVALVGLIPMMSLNPLIIIPVSLVFSLGYDTIVGLINPILAVRYSRQSGTVIMLVSLLGAVYGLLVNGFGPLFYQSFGFLGMILLCLIGTIAGTLFLHSTLKEV